MNSDQLTRKKLQNKCYLMYQGKNGLVYAARRFPILASSLLRVKTAAQRFDLYINHNGDKPDFIDFTYLYQYLIYHIHAPHWTHGLGAKNRIKFQQKRQEVMEIKNWQEMSVYVQSVLDMGIDPLL